MKQYSVVIVEDIENTRQHFVRMIEQAPEFQLVGDSANFTQGCELIKEKQPDLLLTDIGLPDGSGVDLINLINQQKLDTKAMVITVFGDERHVVSALEAGACGYLLKDEHYEQVVDSMLQMMAGGAPISPAIARHMLKRFQVKQSIENSTEGSDSLTQREHEILTLVSKGYMSNEIAEMINLSYHTITTHVRNIYRKLSVHSRTEAVMEGIKLGLITRPN